MTNDVNSGTTATTLTRRELNLIVRLLCREYDRLGKKTADGREVRNFKRENFTREQVDQMRNEMKAIYKNTPEGKKITLASDIEARIEAALAR